MPRKVAVILALCALAVVLSAPTAMAQSNWSSLQAKGYKLPERWGVGVSYYNQKQPYEIDTLVIGLPGWDPSLAYGLPVDNDTTSMHATFDYWLAPYLNVMAMAGNIDGETAVATSSLQLPVPLGDLTVDYNGFMYGAGLTLAGGWKKMFATLTAQYTNTDLDLADSSVNAWVLTPKVGLNFDALSVWVGAMYQDAEERHQGAYTIPPLGTVPFDVTLHEKEPWNYLVGLSLGLGEHWVLIGEGGFGDRDAYLVHLEYRW
jgi:hypothetical protein